MMVPLAQHAAAVYEAPPQANHRCLPTLPPPKRRPAFLAKTAVVAALLYAAHAYAGKHIRAAARPAPETMRSDFLANMRARAGRQTARRTNEGTWAADRMPNGLVGIPEGTHDVGDPRRVVHLHRLNDTRATCLDGSPGAFYHRAGTAGTGRRHHLIYLQGGAWCTSARGPPQPGGESCEDRALGMLGSTAGDAKAMRLGPEWDPLFSSFLRDYAFTFVRYCDGASFSGNAENSRGAAIVAAVVSELAHAHGLSSANTVVVAGGSAGALGALLQVDRVAAQLEELGSRAHVIALADAGVFLHHNSPRFFGEEHPEDYVDAMRFVYAQQRVAVPEACAAEHAGDEYRCLFAEYSLPHIRSPVFLLQSVFDSWMLGNVLSPADSSHPDLVNAFGDAVEAAVTKAMQRKQKAGTGAVGAFLERCQHHTFGWRGIEAMRDGSPATQLQAFESFVKAAHGDEALDAPMVWRQSGEYPCALCCGQGPSGDGDAYSLSVTQHKALQFGGAILVLCCMLQFLGRLCGMARSARAMMGNSHMHSHSHGG